MAQHLDAAVDQVRRSEDRALRQQGDDRLVKTRYLWLTRRSTTQRQRREFTPLRTSSSRVARAWAIKESAMQLWNYQSRGWAERMWKRWYEWAIRSRLEPVQKVARMIKRHWDGVIDAVLTNVTNAPLRGDQREDPVGQAAGLRVPQPRAVPQRHLLPSGRARPLPRRAGCPHEILKRRVSWWCVPWGRAFGG